MNTTLSLSFSFPCFSDLKRLTTFIVVFFSLQACSTNPVSGGREFAKSEAWELSVGPKYHQEILKQYTVYDDPALQAYVDRIGQQLAEKSHRSDLKFTFTLLDSPQVNAFATPGGYVYITRGIMAYMTKESHLAGVIGHEIGHITARHGPQRAAQQQISGIANAGIAIVTGNQGLTQLSSVLSGALISGYGRKQELQSDELGAQYIARANYDPNDMVDVIGLLKNQELFSQKKAQSQGKQPQAYHGLFSTHPQNDQRLQQVIKAAEQYRDTSTPRPDTGEFLRLTDGMSYGDSEAQGIVRGNKFYHSGLDLFIAFPNGWRVQNQPTQLAAVSPNSSQAIVMSMDSIAQQNTDGYLRSKFTSFREGRSVNTPESEAYAGVATITGQSGQQNVRVGAVKRNDQALVFVAQGKTTLPNADYFDVMQSVRKLRGDERQLAEGFTIELVTAKRGDTFERLARESGLSEYAEDQLRLINDMYPSGQPQPGQLIKIIR